MPSSHTAIGQRLRSSAPANALRRRIRGTASEPRWEGVADADKRPLRSAAGLARPLAACRDVA